jgi:hypothetical protein
LPACGRFSLRLKSDATLVETAGRWSLLVSERNDDVEAVARTLLKRYGVVFRSMLQRESGLPPWRELVRVYRRLEARGEIRGGPLRRRLRRRAVRRARRGRPSCGRCAGWRRSTSSSC